MPKSKPAQVIEATVIQGPFRRTVAAEIVSPDTAKPAPRPRKGRATALASVGKCVMCNATREIENIDVGGLAKVPVCLGCKSIGNGVISILKAFFG